MESVPITVIITVYNRERFILDAINSALNQTLDKNLYEIIVVSNFENEELSHICKQNDIELILSKNISLGAKIKEGIIASHGDIISFLEDDDQFMPGKLSLIFKKMVQEKVVYYHNMFEAIDETGSKINYFKGNPFFNLSCMSIRHDIIRVEALNEITELEELFYLSALDSGKKLVKYGKVLTKYMVHPSQSHNPSKSIESLKKQKEKGYAKYENERKIMSEYFKSARAKRFMKAISTSNAIEMFCLDANKKPNNVLHYFSNSNIPLRIRTKRFKKYLLTRLFPKKMNAYFNNRLKVEVEISKEMLA